MEFCLSLLQRGRRGESTIKKGEGSKVFFFEKRGVNVNLCTCRRKYNGISRENRCRDNCHRKSNHLNFLINSCIQRAGKSSKIPKQKTSPRFSPEIIVVFLSYLRTRIFFFKKKENFMEDVMQFQQQSPKIDKCFSNC